MLLMLMLKISYKKASNMFISIISPILKNNCFRLTKFKKDIPIKENDDKKIKSKIDSKSKIYLPNMKSRKKTSENF